MRGIIRRFEALASTSTAIAADAATLPHGAVYTAHSQTAGRGQRGNTWEAAPGQNLTFSMLLRPVAIQPREAFSISMLTALSIADALEAMLPGRQVSVKWPNDIYVGDFKLCGILIENSFSGSSAVERSIVGIGINVNQRQFLSDAPNPVSMASLSGHDFDLDAVLESVTDRILDDLDAYTAAPDIEALTARYRARQWHGSGIHRWHDNLTGETIEAEIAGIAPDGMLTLATVPPRTYAFKEVSALF